MPNYTLNEKKMFADISDGVAIVINGDTGVYYGMNRLGTQVFTNLTEGSSDADILTALRSMPGAPDGLEEILKKFLNALIAWEVVIPSADNTRPAVFDESILAEDGFTPEASEFNDAQELLLADPIHEIIEDMGWMPVKDALNPDAEDVAQRKAKME